MNKKEIFTRKLLCNLLIVVLMLVMIPILAWVEESNIELSEDAPIKEVEQSEPGNWYLVGGCVVSETDKAASISLAIAEDGTPYVAYCNVLDGYKPTVKKYIEDKGWQEVGILLMADCLG